MQMPTADRDSFRIEIWSHLFDSQPNKEIFFFTISFDGSFE